jgi:hypothetical protein
VAVVVLSAGSIKLDVSLLLGPTVNSTARKLASLFVGFLGTVNAVKEELFLSSLLILS